MSQNPPAVSDSPVLKLLNVESAYGPIKAIRGVITLTEDITTDRCRTAIKKARATASAAPLTARSRAPPAPGAPSGRSL